jgi:hypothetical protein
MPWRPEADWRVISHVKMRDDRDAISGLSEASQHLGELPRFRIIVTISAVNAFLSSRPAQKTILLSLSTHPPSFYLLELPATSWHRISFVSTARPSLLLAPVED